MTELSDYIRLVSGPTERALRRRIAQLRSELRDILAWAEDERAPLRQQEMASIRRVLEDRPLRPGAGQSPRKSEGGGP